MSDLVKIILDADNKATSKIDGVSKSLGALGSVAGGALKLGLAAGAAAVAGMTAALGYMVKGAMEAELAEAQLDATIRSTAKAAADYAAADAVQITTTRESAESIAAMRGELESLTLAYDLDGAKLQEQRQQLIALTAAWGVDALNVKSDTAELRIAEAEHAKMGASIGALSAQIASGSDLMTTSQAKMLGMVKPALQLTRAELIKYASAMQMVTRYDDEVILGAESLMLTFTQVSKEVFPEAVESALDIATVMGTDVKGAIVQVGKALQDPAGVTALKRMGVSFSEFQITAMKAMFETGDTIAYQKMVLKELQTEFGGSARAAGETFAGKLDILKNSLSDVAENAGAKLLVPLKDLASGMLALVQSPGFVALTDTFVARILDGVDAVKKLWAAIASGGVEGGLDELLGLAQGGAVVKAPTTNKRGEQEGLGAMVPTGIIDTSQAETIKQLFLDLQATWLSLQPSLLGFTAWLSTDLPVAAAAFSEFWTNYIMPPFQNLWDSIRNEETGLWPALQLLGGWLSESLPAAFAEFDKAFLGGKGSVNTLKLELINFVEPVQGFIDLLTAIDKALWLLTDAIMLTYEWAHKLWDMLTAIFMTFPGYLNTGGLTFAGGTSFAPGGMAMVGEQGPELMYVPRGSRIWPHGQGPSMESNGSGVGGVVTVVYSPMISLASEDEVMDKLVPLLRRAGVAV